VMVYGGVVNTSDLHTDIGGSMASCNHSVTIRMTNK
jgi:hypothetical protein